MQTKLLYFVEKSAFRGTQKEERGCEGSGGEELQDKMHYCSMKFVIWITVAVFTTQSEAIEVIYGQLGGSVTLPKDKWGGHKVLVRWSKGNSEHVYSQASMGGVPSIGQDMKDRVSLSRTDYSLIIKNLKPEDFTIFKCELRENRLSTSTEYRLYQITVIASPAILLASQTLSLKCTAEKSAVPTKIEWGGPQAQKVEGPRFQSSGPDLRVTAVSVRDHGVWICTVTYGNRKATASASVTVVDLSPSPPQPLYPPLGSLTPSLLLPCSLHTKFDASSLAKVGFRGGSWAFAPFSSDVEQVGKGERLLLLSPQLRWETPQGQRVNGTALETDTFGTNLSIARKVPENGGLYTCTLDFQGGVTLNRSLRVEVLRIVSSQRNPVLEGRELNLTCSLGHSSLNNLTVKWIAPRSSSVLSLPNATHRLLLSIPRVREKDKGTWQCQLLQDGKVLATARLNLKTERAPVDVWLLVSIGGAAVVLILLLALTFICVRRHRQRMLMRRRRKPKYCRCKHPQVKGFYRS
ncbi:CD4-1 molecule isoform X2 [Anguilla anguilla]|uniref:CD4-1 molecule isoform X2 n=1 Tax=Anguilla anguilla TaxID=7936 RepID=UPI0015A90494|nr:CD4-1 molecule isoform X2 [Anguilla anguilla]